jgi:hypothetical protein
VLRGGNPKTGCPRSLAIQPSTEGNTMNTRLHTTLRCLSCMLLLLSADMPADERRHAGHDSARHGVAADPAHRPAPAAPSRFSGGAAPARTLQEQIDPAVRHYWSERCVQQRARGWGHTGDCKHPPYSGAGYGAAPVIVVPYAPRSDGAGRRPGHLRLPPPGSRGRTHVR